MTAKRGCGLRWLWRWCLCMRCHNTRRFQREASGFFAEEWFRLTRAKPGAIDLAWDAEANCWRWGLDARSGS